MVGNYIDTLIASFFTNGVKCKFISRNGWIGEEEAQNLNAVAEFDEREGAMQQLKYQVEQDSLFFGVGILNKT
jgi:acyl CoA:acetate/3-ketoacid CoA transferase beta subunit